MKFFKFSSKSERGDALFEYAIILSVVVVVGIAIAIPLESVLKFTFLQAIMNRPGVDGIPQGLGGEYGNPFTGIDDSNKAPILVISTEPDPPVVLSGETITFRSISYDEDEGDYIDSHVWDIYGDGTVIKTGQTVTHTFTTTEPNAIWQPRLTVTDNHGVSVSQSFSVGAYTTTPPNLPPVVVVDVAPISGPAPLTVTFTSTSYDPDGTIQEHKWNFGDTALTYPGAVETYVYETPGDYEAELLVTDDGGRQAKSHRIFITVDEPEPPNVGPTVSVRASSSEGLTGIALDFITDNYSDSDGTVEYYQWDFGDGSPILGPNIIAGGVPIVQHTYLTPGSFVATMTVFDNDGASASQSIAVTIEERICNDPTIRRQIWNGITGSSLSNVTSLTSFPHSPDVTETLTAIEIPVNSGDNFGDRFYGYIMPDVSGAYTFYIASDDQSEFYLSTDDDPANKRVLASVSSWTSHEQWTKFSSQKSPFVTLQAGEKYYFEIVHKEGGGGDNMSLGWIKPGDAYPPEVVTQDYICFDDSLIPDAPPPPEATPTPGPPVVENLALNKPATQSSTGWSGVASRAVDGNTNGSYSNSSVTHTSYNSQAWWEVDIGEVSSIDEIVLWNRTDCCSNRLSNVHILVSDTPFASTSLAATQAQAGVGDFYVAGNLGASTTVPINRSGRYVRIQLANTNYLSLAEVQVFGILGGATLPPVVNGCNFQAEDATLSGPSVKSNHSGWEGTGFADYPGGKGSNVYIEWTVEVPTAGIYNTDFRYALGSGSRPLEYKLNGGVISSALPFSSTGGWSNWNTSPQQVYLNAGNNTIRLTALNNAGPNVDCLAVYK